MKTPDGQDFSGNKTKKWLGVAARAIASAIGALTIALLKWLGVAARAAASVTASVTVIVLRAIGKFIITTWRLAAALDSALWRGTKLLARKLVYWLGHAVRLAAAAFHSLLLWLPTRTGRAYSAVSGIMLIVAGLWIIDELRLSAEIDAAGASARRPPIDEDDPILARIEGRYVHLSEIEAAARAGGFLRPEETLTPKMAFDRELVEAYVEQRLLAGAAQDEGMQRMPAIMRRANAARDRVLASAYMESRIDEAVTPETVKRLYKAQSDVTQLGDEVNARHIVVDTEEEANEIVALLKNGADFAALARERSIDRATAPLGGEIGWFTRAMMTPALSKAAFATKPGEIAEPFQTEYGWHVLQVTDRRPTKPVPFSQVHDEIEDFLRMRTIETTLQELSEKAQVVYFKPEETPQITAPPPDLSMPAEPAPGAEKSDSAESGETM